MTNKLEISRELLRAWINDLQTCTANVALMQMQELLANHSEEPLGVVEPISDADLFAMADKAFGQVVDYDLRGGPITDYRVLTIGAYGPAIRRLVALARRYPVAPPAPVAVALPERMTWDGLRATACNIRGEGWNACLDKVKELNA